MKRLSPLPKGFTRFNCPSPVISNLPLVFALGKTPSTNQTCSHFSFQKQSDHRMVCVESDLRRSRFWTEREFTNSGTHFWIKSSRYTDGNETPDNLRGTPLKFKVPLRLILSMVTSLFYLKRFQQLTDYSHLKYYPALRTRRDNRYSHNNPEYPPSTVAPAQGEEAYHHTIVL